jgi:uncharacterized membrane protein
MLQAPNIADAAGAELRDVVLAEIPEKVSGGQTGLQAADALMEKDGYSLRVKESGYIQYIDPATIVTLARENDLVIRLLCKPGHFVWCETLVALVWPANRVSEELDRQIRNAFRIGNGRTPTQDVIYAVNQLVEMAVRAMSPAINDPFTAMTCLDHLGEGLARFIRHGAKSPHYYDQENRLRLVLEPVTLDELFSAAFDMLRHASCDNASVLLHMLDVIDDLSGETKSPDALQSLLCHASLIQLESQAGELIEKDRHTIQRRAEALQIRLEDAV